MATKKIRERLKTSTGYDIIHRETEATLVITDDGSTAEAKIAALETGKANAADVYTKTETDTKLSGKSDTSHTHDGRYFTETEVTTKLATKADLVDGLVPASQLPSYVDDVIEVANYAALPATGESGKIYVTIDTNKTYRWSGTAYVEISASIALGETSATAYRGDRGKAAYDHSQTTGNAHGLTLAQLGAAAATHTHTKSQITDFAHTHDDRYFTETEITTNYYSKAAIDSMIGDINTVLDTVNGEVV